MDLIDEQHVVGLEAGQQPRQVSWFVQHRSRSRSDRHSHLVGHNVCQGGLAQTGRAVQQHVVERLGPLLGRLDKHLEVVHGRALPREVFESSRPKHAIQIAIRGLFRLTTHVKIVLVLHHPQGSTYTHEKAPAVAEAFQRGSRSREGFDQCADSPALTGTV